jgi:hypothetical protein
VAVVHDSGGGDGGGGGRSGSGGGGGGRGTKMFFPYFYLFLKFCILFMPIYMHNAGNKKSVDYFTPININ